MVLSDHLTEKKVPDRCRLPQFPKACREGTWYPRELSENYISNARLSGCRHCDGIAFAAQTRSNSEHIEFTNRAAIYGWEGHRAPCFVLQ
jgi:hypothetical protein